MNKNTLNIFDLATRNSSLINVGAAHFDAIAIKEIDDSGIYAGKILKILLMLCAKTKELTSNQTDILSTLISL